MGNVKKNRLIILIFRKANKVVVEFTSNDQILKTAVTKTAITL